jgi:hypothetical protein
MVDFEGGGSLPNGSASADTSSQMTNQRSKSTQNEKLFAPSTVELAAFKRVWATIVVVSSEE